MLFYRHDCKIRFSSRRIICLPVYKVLCLSVESRHFVCISWISFLVVVLSSNWTSSAAYPSKELHNDWPFLCKANQGRSKQKIFLLVELCPRPARKRMRMKIMLKNETCSQVQDKWPIRSTLNFHYLSNIRFQNPKPIRMIESWSLGEWGRQKMPRGKERKRIWRI